MSLSLHYADVEAKMIVGNVLGPEFVKELLRYTIPRPIRNWLRSPARTFEWIADNALFALGVTKKLSLSHNVNVILHPHAFKIGQGQMADPEQRAEFDNFIRQCNSRMFLFDIGAHYGLFSLAAAQLRGKSWGSGALFVSRFAS